MFHFIIEYTSVTVYLYLLYCHIKVPSRRYVHTFCWVYILNKNYKKKTLLVGSHFIDIWIKHLKWQNSVTCLKRIHLHTNGLVFKGETREETGWSTEVLSVYSKNKKKWHCLKISSSRSIFRYLRDYRV